MPPSVCVIIPTYNQAHLVGRAIDSVLAQTYPHLRVVVADDASSDDTGSVVQRRLSDRRVQYQRSEVNRGRVGNYRHALSHLAAADWVLNLDGDDYFIDRDFITRAMQAIDRGGADKVLFFVGRHVLRSDEPSPAEIARITVAAGDTAVKASEYFFGFFHHKRFSHVTTLYRRDLALASGFYEADELSVDVYSLLKLCLHHPDKRVIMGDTVSAVWHQHERNSSKTVSPRVHLSNLALLNRLGAIAAQRGQGSARAWLWRCRLVLFYALVYGGNLWRHVTRWVVR